MSARDNLDFGEQMTAPGVERALVSCLLDAAEICFPRILGLVQAEDFSPGGAPGVLFRFLVQRYNAGKACDYIQVSQAVMDSAELIQDIGGIATLAEIYTNQAVVATLAPDYARAVREKACQRRLAAAADSFLNRLMTDSAEWREHATALVDAVLAEQRGSEERATIVPIREAILQAVDELEEALKNRGHVTHGLATGFTDLDRAFMGLKPSQNLVIAGRPSMGKTALAVNILENLTIGEGHYKEFYQDMKERTTPRQGRKACVLVCLESSQVEMASRMLCGRARVSVQRIRDGLLGQHDVQQITRAGTVLGGSPFYIWDAAGISVEELELELKSFKMKVPDLAAVAVDHCGLLRAKGVKDAGNDYARCGYISNRLRLLWKTLNVVGMPLWQLSREVEKRGDKRPKQSDLRDSGKIEEDASHIIMPFRPCYYDPEQPEDEAYIVIAKNRGGPTNSEGVKVKWEAQFTRFSSLTDRLLSNNREDHQQH